MSALLILINYAPPQDQQHTGNRGSAGKADCRPTPAGLAQGPNSAHLTQASACSLALYRLWQQHSAVETQATYDIGPSMRLAVGAKTSRCDRLTRQAWATRLGRPGNRQRTIVLSFPKSAVLWLAVLLMAGTQRALPQQCPPHAHPVAVAIPGNLRSAQCFCDDGYENVAGACVPVVTSPTMVPAPPSTAACVRAAAEQFKSDLMKCRTPLVVCLENAGVKSADAACAASALVVTPDNRIKFTVVGATIACGDKTNQSADVCGPAWERCRAAPLQTYRTAVATCSNK